MGARLPREMKAVDRQQSQLFSEISALVLNILGTSPLSIQPSQPPSPTPASRLPPLSPSGFASLLLGTSLALMFAGSVTFFIGFLMMPWVLGIVMAFYFFDLGRSIIYASPFLRRTKSPRVHS